MMFITGPNNRGFKKERCTIISSPHLLVMKLVFSCQLIVRKLSKKNTKNIYNSMRHIVINTLVVIVVVD